MTPEEQAAIERVESELATAQKTVKKLTNQGMPNPAKRLQGYADATAIVLRLAKRPEALGDAERGDLEGLKAGYQAVVNTLPPGSAECTDTVNKVFAMTAALNLATPFTRKEIATLRDRLLYGTVDYFARTGYPEHLDYVAHAKTGCKGCTEVAALIAKLDAILGKENTAKDYHEDAEHENGNYQNTCADCGEFFTGHKRRVICRLCRDKETTE